jgi:hypothetical protein
VFQGSKEYKEDEEPKDSHVGKLELIMRGHEACNGDQGHKGDEVRGRV